MSALELDKAKNSPTHTHSHTKTQHEQQQSAPPLSTTVNNTVIPPSEPPGDPDTEKTALHEEVEEEALDMAMEQLSVKQKAANGAKAKKSNNQQNHQNQQKIKPNASRRAAGANWKVLHENASGGNALPPSATNGVTSQKQTTPTATNGVTSQKQSPTPSETNDVATQKPTPPPLTEAGGAIAKNAGAGATVLSKSARMRQKRKNRFIAIDCEMVGTGLNGQDDMLARVSIVNKVGTVLMDKYVKPRESVTDYRTSVSGIRPHDIINGEDFDKVQQEVVELLQGKILVGHAIRNDLAVLHIQHPYDRMRDTSRYKPLCRLVSNGRTPSLKKLAKVILGIDIQAGEHSSVEDARAAMCIYNKLSSEWEEHHQKQQQKKHRH